MIRSLIINKYLSKEFLKIVMNMSFVFFCLGFIINLFEEINFFKDYDVTIKVPSDNTQRIQESHIMIGQILCSLIELSILKQ